MIITPLEIKQLAKIGRKFVTDEYVKKIAHWIGHLPTDDEIDFFFNNLEDAAEWGQVDTEEKTLEEYEAMLLE